MKTTLLFDFLVNKEKNTITVKKEFAAGLQLVWDCHTKSELLDQWFAPQPFKLKTKHMDFREGGYWLYAMVGEGQEHWGRADYEKINPLKGYWLLDGFCNNEGVLNTDLPRAKWQVNFKSTGENTLVETNVTYNSLTDLETVINMGMKEGLTMTLEQLDALLKKLTK